MDDYPTEDEIRKKLRPRLILMAWFCIFVLIIGFSADLSGVVKNAFPLTGAITLALALSSFFWLEKNDFLTGHPAEFFDSAGHVVPRKVAAPFNMWLSLVGTLTWGLGDIPVSLIRCGAMTC